MDLPALTVGATAARLIVAAGAEIVAPEAAWMIGGAAESAMVAEGAATLFPLATAGEIAASVIVAAGAVMLLPAEIEGADPEIEIVAAGHATDAPVAAWIVGASAAMAMSPPGRRQTCPR